MSAETPLDAAKAELASALQNCDSRRLSLSLLAAQGRLLAHASGGPVSILIVEDDLDTREVCRAAFEQLGICVVAVGSMNDAESALIAGRPDVILLDLGLPDSDGLDSLARVTCAARGVPVIVMTGRAVSMRTAKERGASAFLEKGRCSVADVLDAASDVILSPPAERAGRRPPEP